MKAIIVEYIPCQSEENKKFIDFNLKDLREKGKINDLKIFVIEDPARKKVKVEIFFNPYQK